jgi:uncharacterized membrane protein HdeD (DUF308 family)
MTPTPYLWIFDIYALALILAASVLLISRPSHGLVRRKMQRLDILILIAAILGLGLVHILSALTASQPPANTARMLSSVVAGAAGLWVLLHQQVVGIAPGGTAPSWRPLPTP